MTITDENWKMEGTVVLVRPDLTTDPLGKKNHVGVICEANLDFDHIYVQFYYNIVLFSADALLTFLPKDEINKNLAQLPAGISVASFKALIKIGPYLHDDELNANVKAMRIVSDHPPIQPLFTGILKNQISPEIYKMRSNTTTTNIDHYGKHVR
jgi:hypothetical protein